MKSSSNIDTANLKKVLQQRYLFDMLSDQKNVPIAKCKIGFRGKSTQVVIYSIDFSIKPIQTVFLAEKNPKKTAKIDNILIGSKRFSTNESPKSTGKHLKKFELFQDI